MIKYLIRRIAGWLALIVLATNLTYFLAWGFLDPRSNYTDRRPPLPPEVIDNTLGTYNLSPSTPLLERWWTWITNIVTKWDWGASPVGVNVNGEVAYRMWVSAQLVLGATILATVIGVGLGVYTASRQYKLADRVWQGISIFTMNIPAVVMGFIVVVVGIRFNQAVGGTVFYVTGAKSIGVEGFFPVLIDTLQHLVLPTISLIIIQYSATHFLQRSLLLDNINADYVRTARAKGLTKSQAVRKHALRTSLIPVATSVAFSIPAVFTGAVMTETIFGWEGMGRYFIQTITKNDVHGVVASAAFAAMLTAVGAILSDIVVAALDPRVRVS
ncbi:ABC transporter permease [Enemella sp. A6]|uniref:ABC transporter permease n=1 Tax=Enemella sp. A6 TaxID=3440152 RepID=UPI003EB86D54